MHTYFVLLSNLTLDYVWNKHDHGFLSGKAQGSESSDTTEAIAGVFNKSFNKRKKNLFFLQHKPQKLQKHN